MCWEAGLKLSNRPTAFTTESAILPGSQARAYRNILTNFPSIRERYVSSCWASTNFYGALFTFGIRPHVGFPAVWLQIPKLPLPHSSSPYSDTHTVKTSNVLTDFLPKLFLSPLFYSPTTYYILSLIFQSIAFIPVFFPSNTLEDGKPLPRPFMTCPTSHSCIFICIYIFLLINYFPYLYLIVLVNFMGQGNWLLLLCVWPWGQWQHQSASKKWTEHSLYREGMPKGKFCTSEEHLLSGSSLIILSGWTQWSRNHEWAIPKQWRKPYFCSENKRE